MKELDLSFNQLSELPSEVGQFNQLEALDLSHNRLQALPDEFASISSLRVLLLHGNDALATFSVAPSQLFSLQQLTVGPISVAGSICISTASHLDLPSSRRTPGPFQRT